MRIGIILPSLRGGGAERVMMQLAQGLDRHGYQVTVVLIERRGEEYSHLSDSIRVICFRSRRVSTSVFKLAHFFRTAQMDLVISSLPHLNVFCVIAKLLSRCVVKLVLVEHNTLSKSLDNSASLRGKHLDIPMRLTYPHADAICAVSYGVRDDLASTLHLQPEDISVVYNPVVTKELLSCRATSLKQIWPELRGSKVILGAGRLTKAKNFPLLVHAFAEARRTLPVRLVILGDGPERRPLIELSKQLRVSEDCYFPGFITNPYEYMKAADIFVLSSLWEGLPTVLIEALACGMKIISTDCPSGPREILGDGRWGTLVPVGDQHALVLAITEAFVDLHNKPDTEPAWSRFTIQTAVKQYIRIFEGLYET